MRLTEPGVLPFFEVLIAFLTPFMATCRISANFKYRFILCLLIVVTLIEEYSF